jgi:hypothetical protein
MLLNSPLLTNQLKNLVVTGANARFSPGTPWSSPVAAQRGAEGAGLEGGVPGEKTMREPVMSARSNRMINRPPSWTNSQTAPMLSDPGLAGFDRVPVCRQPLTTRS